MLINNKQTEHKKKHTQNKQTTGKPKRTPSGSPLLIQLLFELPLKFLSFTEIVDVKITALWTEIQLTLKTLSATGIQYNNYTHFLIKVLCNIFT